MRVHPCSPNTGTERVAHRSCFWAIPAGLFRLRLAQLDQLPWLVASPHTSQVRWEDVL